MFTDPILKKLVKKYPAPTFSDRSDFLFEDLVESIVSQQLSVKAANTIFTRFKKLFNIEIFPTPKEILTMSDDRIREAGISRPKIGYIKGIAQAFAKDEIDVKEIKKMTDGQAILQLTNLKGVGKWTAEMILIFTLQRPDVFSLGDLGLRNAVKNLYGITEASEILKLSETWSPHRSTASWYLWRSLENS